LTSDEKPIRKQTRRREDSEPDVASGTRPSGNRLKSASIEAAFEAFAASNGTADSPSMPPQEGSDHHSLWIPQLAPVMASAALAEIARALAVSESCAEALKHASGMIAGRVRDIAGAEMARAAILLQLWRFLNGELAPDETALSVPNLVRHAIASVESESVLRGIVVSTRAMPTDLQVQGDEALLVDVLRGLLLTTFTLLDDVENPLVIVTTDESAGRCVLAVGQTHVTAPRGWPAHAGDASLPADPDAIMRAMTLCAATRIAAMGHGHCDTRVQERSTMISLDLPSASRLT
jgi:hypothetical protein